MKLNIERWLDTQNPSANVRDLFRESVLCYKIGAYRASLLYTYLAFLTILKERLMLAHKPSAIPEGMWNDLIRNIQKENRWEEALFDSTQNTTHVIFQVSEHIRLQIKYWRDRRNDSVHYKENEINEHHVEAIWSFIQSNLSKITVEGGKESLLNKFAIHFDSTKTRPGLDYSHLVDEIPSSVELPEMTSFLTSLQDTINQFFYDNDSFLEVCHKCLNRLPAAYTERIIHYLRHKDDLYVSMILHNPSVLMYFGLTAIEIRQLWSVQLRLSYGVLNVLAALLRSNLIPEEEKEEALTRFLSISSYPPEDAATDNILWEHGFYQKLYDRFFTREGLLQWGSTNGKAALIMNYIEKRGIDDLMLSKLCEAFNKSHYSFNLASMLNRFFDEHQGIRTEFIERIRQSGLTLPRHLTSLFS